MFKTLLGCGLIACAFGVSVPTARASAIELDFVSDAKATLSFNSANSGSSVGSFSFQSTPVASGGTGHVFNINNATPQLSPLTTTLHGDITGTFRIQAISNLSSTEQIANVTGTGSLSIFDGSKTFTSNISWSSIDVVTGSNSSSASMNLNGVTNLTNFSYTGSNPDLLSLLSEAKGVASLSMTISRPVQTLTQLTSPAAGGAEKTTLVKNFSGSLSASPEPASIALLATALVAFAPFALKRARLRNAH